MEEKREETTRLTKTEAQPSKGLILYRRRHHIHYTHTHISRVGVVSLTCGVNATGNLHFSNWDPKVGIVSAGTSHLSSIFSDLLIPNIHANITLH